jgi:hypothetical protein
MSKYSDNHYVPQFLLRRFQDINGRLYYFNKRATHKGIEHRNTATIFSARNIYTFRTPDGRRDVSLERDVFMRTENRASEVIEKIVSSARASRLPNLTLADRRVWDEYFIDQWKRTPDFQRKVYGEGVDEVIIGELLSEFEAMHRPLSNEKRAELQSEPVRSRIMHNARVIALAKRGGEGPRALATRGLGIARITNPNKSFIIGSFPIIKLTLPDRTHLADPVVEAWFPIAHDVVVGPSASPSGERLITIGDPHIRRINQLVFRQSTEVAGRSRQLLESLAGIKGKS